MDPTDKDEQRKIFSEFSRVLSPRATLLFGVFQANGRSTSLGAQLGVFENGTQRTDRIVALWRNRNDTQEIRNRIARWTGCSSYEADERLARHREYLADWFDLLSAFADRHRAQAHPEKETEESFSWSLPGLPSGDVMDGWKDIGLEALDERLDAGASTRMWLLKRLEG